MENEFQRPARNINPGRTFPSLFEPVDGSAPEVAGRGITVPIGQIRPGAKMLDHLAKAEGGAAVITAIEAVLAQPEHRTRDLGGEASARECALAITLNVAHGERAGRTHSS